MVAVGATPQFGTLATSYTRGPMATKNFQSLEFNFMDSLNQTPSSGAPKTLTADVAADYAGIRANMGDQGNGGFINKIASWIVGNKIANA